ncbi:MAG: PDZ domain-containing protein [Planctomycetaceae bacterium]
MTRLRKLWLLGCLTGLAANPARAEEPADRPTGEVESPAPEEPGPGEAKPARRPPPTAAEIRHWIGQLASDSFEARDRATKELESAGAAAIAPLAAAAETGELEVTYRAVRALETIAHRGAGSEFEEAQGVLERLAESKRRSVARRAATALAGLTEVRHRHALARVFELGARRHESPLSKVLVAVDEGDEPVELIIDRRWKGGDEGIINLRRIARLDTIYVIDGAPVTDEVLARLQAALPRLQVQRRGEAMLGVSCDHATCQIQTVADGSAAARAGLERGDRIVKYDGEDVGTFSRLIEMTRKYRAGDKIKLEVIRAGMPMAIEVELGEWR